MRTLKAALLITLSLALASPVRAALVASELARVGREPARATSLTAEAPRLSDLDREALSAAQRATSPDLEHLRGGHDVTLTDHDLEVIAIVLLVVVVIVIIA